MNIGFLGFGEAAYNISIGLGAEKTDTVKISAFDVLQNDPARGPGIRRHAEEAGVELLAKAADVARNADVLFSAIPSGFALSVCEEVLDYVREGQIYADVSASTPATKQEIWTLLEPRGVLFADAAMLGSLPQDKHRVPITASGNGAKAFYDAMTPLGMRITLAGEAAGAASAIKLMRSVFMKGIASCMYEMLLGAESYNVSAEVITSISRSMDGIPFAEHLDRLVTSTAVHAARRAAELKGSEKMLAECGLDAVMSDAARRKHEQIAEYDFSKIFESGKAHWLDVIELIRLQQQEVATCR